MRKEVENHLKNDIIPFWKKLRDDVYGGYYGFMDYDLKVDEKAVKGCILNSRITWFFANAYMVLKDESLLEEAKHGYEFMCKYCLDNENGGIFWTVQYDGTPDETLKHTYNQAFLLSGGTGAFFPVLAGSPCAAGCAGPQRHQRRAGYPFHRSCSVRYGHPLQCAAAQ